MPILWVRGLRLKSLRSLPKSIQLLGHGGSRARAPHCSAPRRGGQALSSEVPALTAPIRLFLSL